MIPDIYAVVNELYCVLCVDPAMWDGEVAPAFAGEGDNVTLLCDVCMNPWGQFTWTYDDGELPPNIQYNNSITLLSLTAEHFGVYYCHAENTIESRVFRMIFALEVSRQGDPGEPTDLTVSAHTSVSVTLGWTCGHNGGDEEMVFQMEGRKESEEQFTVYDPAIPARCSIGGRIDPDYRVDDLEGEVKYIFRISAINRFMKSEQGPYTTAEQLTSSK